MRSAPSIQGDFFDETVYGRLLPEEDELLAIKQQIDLSYVEEETADLYADSGRPAYPAIVLFKMLFLEYYANLSDVQVARQCQYNLLYRVFVGLGIEDQTPDDTTLVVFRRRLGEKRFRRLFDRLIAWCQEQGLLEGRLKIVDATHVVARVAIPNSVNLLRQARRQVIRAIEKQEGRLRADLTSRFSIEGALHGVPTAAVLCEEVQLSETLVSESQPYGEVVAQEVSLLKQILHPQEGDKVVSVVDPEARFGHKSPQKTFVGYKVHVAEDSSELVTSLEVLKGNEHEGHCLPQLLAQEQTKGVFQAALVADGLYNSASNRELITQAGMVGYIPLSKRRIKSRHFRYDVANNSIVCPAGETSIGSSRQGLGTLYTFSPSQCLSCEEQLGCPSLNGGRVRVYLSDNLRGAWAMPSDSMTTIEQERKRVERKFGEAKQWHHLGHARYWGKSKIGIQALMTFFVINVKRMLKLLSGKADRVAVASAS
jgi:IS5 family transposase